MFKKNEKPELTPLEILSQELTRLHSLLKQAVPPSYTMDAIRDIHKHLFKLNETYLPARIKSIEDSIADLYLTDTKGGNK